MPPAHSGARLVLVAKFNQRYHRTGCALRDTLAAMGTDVVAVEERTRGLDALLGRDLESRLRSALRAHRPDLVLVFKGASLAPEAVDRLRKSAGARWANWFPDGPHLLDLSLRIGRAYDRCFIFDTSMVERHRALGRPAEYAQLAHLDGGMLALTFVLAIGASLLAGLLPAWRAMRVPPALQLKSQ